MYAIEVTDTFAGEANYCWVKRGKHYPNPRHVSPLAKKRALIAAVREVAGWPSSVRVHVDDYGDGATIRPQGLLQVAFANWQDHPTD